MNNWRSWKIGDIIEFFWDEFDGSGSLTGTLNAIEIDHALVLVNDLQLWVDESTQHMFKKLNN